MLACLIALGLGVSRILGTGRNADLLQDVKALAPDRIDVHAVGESNLAQWVLDHNNGEGADIVIVPAQARPNSPAAADSTK